MLIERKLKTPGGCPVEIDGKTYKFLPADPNDPDSPHVCEVKDAKHAKLLLEVDGGGVYVEVGSGKGTVTPDEPVTEVPDDLKGKTKKELAAIAKDEFGVELSTQKSVKTLIGEIMRLRADAG